MKTFELRIEEKMMDTLSNQLITLSVDLFFCKLTQSKIE